MLAVQGAVDGSHGHSSLADLVALFLFIIFQKFNEKFTFLCQNKRTGALSRRPFI
jgi:hypothetical protein